MRVVKAAAVQLSPVLYSREGTVGKVVQKIHELGQQAVQFATFPETVVPYYPYFSFMQPAYQIVGGREHLRQHVPRLRSKQHGDDRIYSDQELQLPMRVRLGSFVGRIRAWRQNQTGMRERNLFGWPLRRGPSESYPHYSSRSETPLSKAAKNKFWPA